MVSCFFGGKTSTLLVYTPLPAPNIVGRRDCVNRWKILKLWKHAKLETLPDHHNSKDSFNLWIGTGMIGRVTILNAVTNGLSAHGLKGPSRLFIQESIWLWLRPEDCQLSINVSYTIAVITMQPTMLLTTRSNASLAAHSNFSYCTNMTDGTDSGKSLGGKFQTLRTPHRKHCQITNSEEVGKGAYKG